MCPCPYSDILPLPTLLCLQVLKGALQLTGWSAGRPLSPDVFPTPCLQFPPGHSAASFSLSNPKSPFPLLPDAGAEAFTTAGKVINSLAPRHSWKRTSYTPREGMYVREEIAKAMELSQDAANDKEGEYVGFHMCFALDKHMACSFVCVRVMCVLVEGVS